MERPDFEKYFPSTGDNEFADSPGSMKRFLIDSLRWVEQEKPELLEGLNIDLIEQAFTDDMILKSDPKEYPVEARIALHKILNSKAAGEIFDPILQRMDSSIAEIELMRNNKAARPMPGMPIMNNTEPASNEELAEAMYLALRHQVFQKMAPVLIRAAALSKPQIIEEKITGMEEAMRQALELVPEASEEAQESMQEIIDYTRIYTRLVDENDISRDHYDRFMNVLISKFVENRVDDINREIENHAEGHKDHEPEECNMQDAAALGVPVMHVLWRRYYGEDKVNPKTPCINAITDISCILFDVYNNSIEFIGLTMHPALEHSVMENLNKRIPSDDKLKAEVFELFTEFMKSRPELVASLKTQHEDDDSAAIMVSMSSACPQLKILDECIIISSSDADDLLSASDIDDQLAKLLEG